MFHLADIHFYSNSSSEWFPTPDHHDHHHHHEEHHDHGWADRKDSDAAGSNKFVFKRSEQNTAQPQSPIQPNTKSLVQSPVYFPTPAPRDTTAGVVGKT